MPISVILSPDCAPSKAQIKPASDNQGPAEQKFPGSPFEPWQELAYARDWEGAILGYLREAKIDLLPLWKIVNEICAESLPKDRAGSRLATLEILAALRRLCRRKLVKRLQRNKVGLGGRWLALDDVQVNGGW